MQPEEMDLIHLRVRKLPPALAAFLVEEKASPGDN